MRHQDLSMVPSQFFQNLKFLQIIATEYCFRNLHNQLFAMATKNSFINTMVKLCCVYLILPYVSIGVP
ncbi:hypothetical protein VNO78_01132 [Psophocarpus tetragonolobus]|uniref:Uncharacterized protein n=1 Tax=Psophocarpus tetragonolobus TaxID=3891 RepID=A0AAN9TA51_PSOTE